LTTLKIISKWKRKDPTQDEHDITLAALSLNVLIVDMLKISKNNCYKEKINCEGKWRTFWYIQEYCFHHGIFKMNE
jgi:hypothetical protein